MPTTITRVDALDIRFPTGRARDGSDAMNPDPDYSAAYVVLRTDRADGAEGHGLTFTIGRGNELCVAAIQALAPLVTGLTLEQITADMAGFWRRLTGDSQLRWVGPEKGVLHLGTAALVNAVWGLYAKVEGKPLWQLLADMSSEELVSCIDFRYLTDALTPQDALDLLRANEPTRAARTAGPGGHTSRSRWAATWPTMCGGRPSCATRSVSSGSSCSTPIRCGRWTRQSPACASWPASIPGGSRSRPAPTTCWATPPSRRRSRRSASRPGSSVTTA